MAGPIDEHGPPEHLQPGMLALAKAQREVWNRLAKGMRIPWGWVSFFGYSRDISGDIRIVGTIYHPQRFMPFRDRCVEKCCPQECSSPGNGGKVRVDFE